MWGKMCAVEKITFRNNLLRLYLHHTLHRPRRVNKTLRPCQWRSQPAFPPVRPSHPKPQPNQVIGSLGECLFILCPIPTTLPMLHALKLQGIQLLLLWFFKKDIRLLAVKFWAYSLSHSYRCPSAMQCTIPWKGHQYNCLYPNRTKCFGLKFIFRTDAKFYWFLFAETEKFCQYIGCRTGASC